MSDPPQPQQQTPDDPRNHEVSTRKPTGYDMIFPRLKDTRRQALKELYSRENHEASATVLRSEEGGGIPPGSFEMHMAWFKGERRNGDPKPWWPDDDIALVEEVRRERLDHSTTPTRIYGLTEYGEAFTRYMLDAEEAAKEKRPDTLRADLQSQSDRIDAVVNTNTEHDRRISELEEQVSKNESVIGAIKEQLSKYDEALGWSQ